MASSARPTFNYTARDYDGLRAQLEAFIQATRPEEWTDFYESNLGTMLVDLLALVGDTVSYGQDVLGQESFLATARRYESALRAALSVGYTPRSVVAATATLKSSTLPASVVLNGATIAAGTSVQGANGLRYETEEDLTIDPGTAVLSLPVRQGQKYTETFTPTKAAGQEFTTARGVVENSRWAVYVGDPTLPANLWTQVANVGRETDATQTYEVAFDGDGKLRLKFGDNNAGKIPDAAITLQYRVANGEAGNTPVGTISGNVQVVVIGLGTTVSIPVRNTDAAATGGRDRETVDELRASIPAFLRTLDVVRTTSDYADALTTGVGVRLAFADVPLSSYQGNVVRVHIWDAEQVTFTATSPLTSLTSSVLYNQYVQAPTSRVHTVQQYLRPRTLMTVHNVVVRPTVSWVDLDLGYINYRKGLFRAADVHLGIVQAVVRLFETSSGFAVRMADLYDAVQAVDGVSHFTIKSVVWEHTDWDNAPSTIVEEFRTDQDASGLVGGPFLALRDLVVPAVAERRYYDDAFLYDNEVAYDADIDNPNVQAINLRSLTFDLRA